MFSTDLDKRNLAILKEYFIKNSRSSLQFSNGEFFMRSPLTSFFQIASFVLPAIAGFFNPLFWILLPVAGFVFKAMGSDSQEMAEAAHEGLLNTHLDAILDEEELGEIKKLKIKAAAEFGDLDRKAQDKTKIQRLHDHLFDRRWNDASEPKWERIQNKLTSELDGPSWDSQAIFNLRRRLFSAGQKIQQIDLQEVVVSAAEITLGEETVVGAKAVVSTIQGAINTGRFSRYTFAKLGLSLGLFATGAATHSLSNDMQDGLELARLAQQGY